MTNMALMSSSCSGAALVIALLTIVPSTALAADCFDGLRIGLFTERHYSERDKPWRDRTNDPKIDHAAKTALRSLRADISLTEAKTLEAALLQARGGGLPVLAYLDVEAQSAKSDVKTMVDVEAVLRLQFLNAGNGAVLGESTDFETAKGLDIEQVLPKLVEVSSLSTMAEEAGRNACKNGLNGPTVVSSSENPAPDAQAAPQYDPALISQIQYTLNDLGFDVGTPDGIFGGLTERAVKKAQVDMRLTPDGKASEGLLTKLENHARQMTIETQRLLQSLGRTKGQPSGVVDDETTQAIEAVELDHGLTMDGKPDPDLIRVLKAAHRGGGMEPPSSEAPDDDPALRFRIETLLFELDYLENPPSAEKTLDGEEAIRDAEINLGLPVDGLPDVTLLRELKARRRG